MNSENIEREAGTLRDGSKAHVNQRVEYVGDRLGFCRPRLRIGQAYRIAAVEPLGLVNVRLRGNPLDSVLVPADEFVPTKPKGLTNISDEQIEEAFSQFIRGARLESVEWKERVRFAKGLMSRRWSAGKKADSDASLRQQDRIKVLEALEEENERLLSLRIPKKEQGLIEKYRVERVDDKPLGACIVLEFNDPNSHAALATWADTVEADGYAALAQDVRRELNKRATYEGKPCTFFSENQRAHETQESICRWAEETFGAAKSLFRILTRANEEMAELLVAVELYPEKAPEECADVALVLCRAYRRMHPEGRLLLDFTSPSDKQPSGIAAAAAKNLAVIIQWETESGKFSAKPKLVERIIRLLNAICAYSNTTLQAEIDRKMAINRKRTWDVAGDGHGYHCGG